jgi:serine/threonine-protein kinase
MRDETAPPSDAEPQSRAVVGGRYQLGKLLGDGRTGKVYRAHDTQSTERVAVKLLHKPLCAVPEQVRRFAREFDATSRIDHPNVVRSIAFGSETEGELAGTHYLVMELLDGRRLGDVLRRGGGIDVARAARIGLDVARALAAAHEHGVVHRDIEPNNVVLVRHRGRESAKVLDFGLARLASNDEALTDFGVRLGTPEYMSPEYVETGELEPRSDVYALGVLLYAMLSGSPPFSGRTLTVMQEHVNTQPPPLTSRVPGLPTALDGLVSEMLAKQPERRPAADEVVERLQAILPALDAENDVERRAHRSFAPMPAPPPAAVAHHSDSGLPVYPDPKPLPKLPILITVVLLGFAALGSVSVAAILLLLLLL